MHAMQTRGFYEFGPFQLDTAERTLMGQGEVVPLNPKAFDLLLVLVSKAGRVVDKEELMCEVWPDTFVEENNLTVNISALRKALREVSSDRDYIQTVQRRGYRFAVSVHRTGEPGEILAKALGTLNGSGHGPIFRSGRADSPAIVGRDDELEKLSGLFGRSLNGAGQFVLITGEAGIGKTVLTQSFLRSAQNRYPELLIGRGGCVEQYGTGEAYLPFLEALREILLSSRNEQLVVTLRRTAPTWCLQFPSIFSETALGQLQREAVGANKERMLRELGDALEEITAAVPVVLCLEDLHWADPSTIDLIQHLGRRAKHHRLLLLGTARPEQDHRHLKNCKLELYTQSAIEEIVIQCLGNAHVSQYLNNQFCPNNFPAELAEMIYRKTEGHPLFVTGVFQLLREHEDVVDREGTWVLTRQAGATNLSVPASVRSMIARKIEVLEPEDRKVLQYASIEGEEFLSTVLAELLGVDELNLEERLDRLEKIHLLVHTLGEEELPDGNTATRYRFVHALYQNFLYAELLNKRRTLLHRQAGEILVRCYKNQTARVAMALATHFERGRDFARAVEYLNQAASNASALYAHAQAVEHYSRALALIEKLPEEARDQGRMALYKRRGDASLSLGRPANAEDDYTFLLRISRAKNHAQWECRALTDLANVHHYTRKPDEMGTCAEQAIEVAERIGDRALWSEAKGQLAASRQVIGRVAEAHTLFEESIPAARSIGHVPALLQGLTYRGVAHFFQSEYKQSVAAETEASHLAAASGNGFFFALSLTFLGFGLANRGQMSEALSALNEALSMATRNANQIVLARAPNGVGWIHREIGNLREAVAHNEACVETARRAKIYEAESNSLINLVHDYTALGEPTKARAAMEQADSVYDREIWNRWRFFDIRHQAACAEYWLAAGKLDRAREHAQTLLNNAVRYGVPKYVAVGRRLLGEILSISGDTNAAEQEFDQALQALKANPAPLVEWKTHASLGRLLLGCHRPAAARESFQKAASVVCGLAAGIVDPDLKACFLDQLEVRQVTSEGKS